MSVTWKQPGYRFVSLVEFGKECSHRNIEFVCPATEQFAILTVHSQTADRVLDRQVDQPGYHFFTVLNAPKEVESWEDLVAILPEWQIANREVRNSGQYVFTNYQMSVALCAQRPMAEFAQYQNRPVSWANLRHPNFSELANPYWKGDHMFPSRFQEIAYSETWPTWMQPLARTRPDDWLDVHVHIYATLVAGRIMNVGIMESVWVLTNTSPVKKVEQTDGITWRAFSVERKKFYRRRNPAKYWIVETAKRAELEAIRFVAPSSPLWRELFDLQAVRQQFQIVPVPRPPHKQSFTALYNQLRHEGLPKGLAKRQALSERREADLASPEWQAYLHYLEEPETFLAQLEEEIAIASAQAEADNARLIAVAQVQWQKEVEEFRKKWLS